MNGESVVMVSEDEKLAADDVHHTLGIKLIGGIDADKGRPHFASPIGTFGLPRRP
ncbi:MAG: hypothetical protein M3120_07290 [Pseudomonadota bacterium]|nr:hypothetical protein [Pseudomonadota bacterium]